MTPTKPLAGSKQSVEERFSAHHVGLLSNHCCRSRSLLRARASIESDNRQPEILRNTIPFIILATLSVGGRFLARRMRRISLGADDYVIVLALVILATFADDRACWLMTL